MGNLVSTPASPLRYLVADIPCARSASEPEKPTQVIILNDCIIHIGREGFMGIHFNDEN